MIPWLKIALAVPPITAPIPNGMTLPRTTMPCLVPYLVTKFLPSTLLTARIFEYGMPWTSCRAQCWPVRSATLPTPFAPASPSMMAMTSSRRRSMSWIVMPVPRRGQGCKARWRRGTRPSQPPRGRVPPQYRHSAPLQPRRHRLLPRWSRRATRRSGDPRFRAVWPPVVSVATERCGPQSMGLEAREPYRAMRAARTASMEG